VVTHHNHTNFISIPTSIFYYKYMSITDLPLNKIRTDLGTQMRIKTDDDTVKEYIEVLDDLPPITVFEVDGEYVLVDGFHRYAAYKQAGRDTIECEIIQGTLDDAREYACGANRAHGLRRNDSDKRKAVAEFFNIPGRDTLNNSEVARKLGVSIPFVKNVRDELGVKASPAAHHGKGADSYQERLNDLILKPVESATEGESSTENTITITLSSKKPQVFVTALLEKTDIKFLKACRDYLNHLLQ
jgi:uncharacterized ParB-like nuclease family protein